MDELFLPMTAEDLKLRNWDGIDILLITGDAYVDHPSFGTPIIGRVLENCGYKVGILAQIDWKDPEALKVMGRPRLGVGISSGNLDSMVNIYTAGRRLRREDAFSEGGLTGKRPPHALTVYAQLARQAFPGIFVVIGGLEASLRRVAHYDYWQDKIRPSVLVDSKANILCYGMGERTMPEIFRRVENNEPLSGIPGTAILLGKKDAEAFVPGDKYIELPSFERHLEDKDALIASTVTVESQMNSLGGCGLYQRYNDRILVVEKPAKPLEPHELDAMHALPFVKKVHPKYKLGVPAYETVKDSVMAVRGCPGGCAFCGLVVHQGRQVMSRSEESILAEVKEMTTKPFFRGTISDIGGAAGNIYGSTTDPEICKKCHRSSCLFPKICPNYKCDGLRTVELLRKVRAIPKVKHVHINSGIRLDLALRQKELFREIVHHHVSGHLKVAPEHLNDEVLRYMRKNPSAEFYEIMRVFEEESKKCGKEQYIIPLFISNFPGCTQEHMKTVDDFLKKHNWSLQQVQDYIPLPMTMGAAMYYCGKTPDGTPIHVNRGLAERRPQIEVLKKKRSPHFKNNRDNNRRNRQNHR